MSTLQVNRITNSSGTSSININSLGVCEFPNQPKFAARGISNTTAATRVLKFDQSIEYNVGSHYNSTNGRFTAPVTGNYLLSFFVFLTGTAARDLVNIQVNGVGIQEFTQEQPTGGSGSGYVVIQGSIIYKLTASDYVDISTSNTVLGSDTGYSGFFGQLVT